MIFSLWKNRELIAQLTKREVLARYRGSALGVFWSLLTPFFMLIIYTFVFGVVFNSHWRNSTDNKWEFALILFCGLSLFGIFSEILSRAPSLVLNNPNYIKRVVFPLEILPIALIGSALVHGLISLFVLITMATILTGHLPLTILFLPVILLPLILFSAGLAWFFASLGVYFRDVAQLMPIALSALMFLSPIFYPISAIPGQLKIVYYLNPLSYVVEDARNIIIWGHSPNWLSLLVVTAASMICCALGYLWFQKTKKGFVDVI
jgi:lipopolysaccharide transport system permease protein